MSTHLLSVSTTTLDGRAKTLLEQAHTLGLELADARVADLYWLDGLTVEDTTRLMNEAVVDPVTETLDPIDPIDPLDFRDNPTTWHTLDIGLLPGVTDPRAETLREAARLLDYPPHLRVATGRRYHLKTDRTTALALAKSLLANPVIERFALNAPLPPAFVEAIAAPPPPEQIALDLDDAGLLALSASRRLALDLAEMRSIATFYKGLDRPATDLELEMFAQTWSEHCVHKTFRARITSTETDREGAITTFEVDGLLKSYLRKATDTIAAPWVRSAFVDNAGIVALTDTHDVAIKVETHNHPSALEPFGGANTGVGGVVRDVIGVSARPIANLDVLCFAPPDTSAIPPKVLHPRRIRDGVVHGVEDYGNKMGIPTVAGTIFYHPGYLRNPLVFCGTVGVLPTGAHPSRLSSGDLIVVLGGRTGRDGLRGATFSSLAMDGQTATVSGGAVQIGHPITEKQVMEVVLESRDQQLYSAITDCGAGGLSSAIGEMGGKIGAFVELAKVPLKYAGLAAWEIWLSEAQERMVLAVPPDRWPQFQAIARHHVCEATVIGHFGHTTHLADHLPPEPAIEIHHHGERVGLLGTTFLDEGLPRRILRGHWEAPPLPPAPPTEDLQTGLDRRLADRNLAPRTEVIRRYDHEVGGGTVVKPLVGSSHPVQSNGAVLVPLEVRHEVASRSLENQETLPLPGLALGIGLDPTLGELDPYVMAWRAIDEAIRNVVALGGAPDHTAILDNFSWGDPKKEDRLGALVRCTRGCHDAAIHYGTPFVSGKDSLNNEWTDEDGVRHPIPPTLVITALARVPDVSAPRKTGTPAFIEAGDLIYLSGVLNDHPLAFPDAAAVHRYRRLHQAFQSGLVRGCHDVSRGGVLLALAEMSLASDGLGADVDLTKVPGAKTLPPQRRAFCEGPGLHLIAVAPADAATFESLFTGHHLTRIGVVIGTPTLRVDGTLLTLG